MSTDVLVVGCGPVGVMAALRCAQRGLSVVAIDCATEIFPHPRAIGMDDEIQRLFKNAGLERELRDVSTPLAGAEFVDAAGKRLVGIDIPDGFLGVNGHPPMAMFEQPELERATRAAAVAAGVPLQLGVKALAVTETSTGVSLTVTNAADERGQLEARWLIAADGASSTIRSLTGIGVIDQGYDQEWLVIDTTLLDPDCTLPRVAQQVCNPSRVITFIPGHRNRRRWEIKLNPGETAEQMLDEHNIAELLAPWARADQIRIDRAAVYRFHAVVAETFRRGPVFLAGDSAHQMPPFNGQGMNTGMRDVENLTWKLALVAHGYAADGLLDTYDAERRPHATGQVEHSADAGRLIDSLSRGDSTTTEAGYGEGRPFPHLQHGLVFGDHPAVGHPLPQPTIDGVRLDDILGPGFSLIGSPQNLADDTREFWSRLGALPRTVDHPDIAALVANDETIIVRPDRYVAAVTTDLDAVTHSIREVMTR